MTETKTRQVLLPHYRRLGKKDTKLKYWFYVGENYVFSFSFSFLNIKFSPARTYHFNLVFTLHFCRGHACFITGLVLTLSLKKKNSAVFF